MRKLLTTIFSLFLLISTASTLEWGGTLNNISKISGNKFEDLKLDQKDNIKLWLRVPISKDGRTYFATEGMYQFENIFATETILNSLDLSLCKFTTQFDINDNQLNLSAGRFFVTDATATVFSQASDGLFASFITDKISTSLYAGYTGLLNASMTTILHDPKVSYTYDTKSLYPLCAKYIPLGLSLTINNLFLNQTGLVECWDFFDVNANSTNYNRFYATASLNGPLASFIFYNFAGTLGSENFTNLSLLTSLDFRFFFKFLNSNLKVNGIYASGNNGSFSAFRTFTSNTAYMANGEPEYSAFTKMGLSYSIKPIEVLQILAGADVVFTCPNESFTYNGIQVTGNITYQMFYDVRIVLSAEFYFAQKQSDNNNTITASAVIAF